MLRLRRRYFRLLCRGRRRILFLLAVFLLLLLSRRRPVHQLLLLGDGPGPLVLRHVDKDPVQLQVFIVQEDEPAPPARHHPNPGADEPQGLAEGDPGGAVLVHLAKVPVVGLHPRDPDLLRSLAQGASQVPKVPVDPHLRLRGVPQGGRVSEPGGIGGDRHLVDVVEVALEGRVHAAEGDAADAAAGQSDRLVGSAKNTLNFEYMVQKIIVAL